MQFPTNVQSLSHSVMSEVEFVHSFGVCTFGVCIRVSEITVKSMYRKGRRSSLTEEGSPGGTLRTFFVWRASVES